MGKEYALGPTSELPSGKVVAAGPYAVGNSDGQLFAVSRRCRHLGADLANGSIDAEGCLVCPWHQSKYDVHTGRMVRGPRDIRQGAGAWCGIQGAHQGLAARSRRSNRTRRQPLRPLTASGPRRECPNAARRSRRAAAIRNDDEEILTAE